MKTLRCAILIVTLFFLSACGKEALTPLASALDQIMAYGTVNANFCTSPPTPAKQYLKYLFIVDHSDSNQAGFPLVTGDVSDTDPTGARRYGPMINFINNLAPDPNNITSFGLIDFSDVATQPGNLVNLQGFDPSESDFVSIATTDWIGGGTALAPAPIDGGFTNYQGALQMAFQLIHDDAQFESALKTVPIVATQYVIVFVTDGVPTVATPGGPNPTYTQTFATDISPVITDIMNLKNDPIMGPYISNITLNTAYYYNTTQLPAAESLLQQMASAGNGLYIQFGSGQNILYQQFAPPSRNVVNELADVFVQNENGVWWDNGQFMTDTDGDGLPDSIELQMGSNPNVADSDGNGVSDLIEYRTKGAPCNDASCNPAKRDQYAICAGYSPVTDANGNVTFSSSDEDGMNDCEKYLAGGQVGNFNSNGDLIPDQFAFFNTLPIIPGTANTAFADPFGDGISNYNKLKLGLPIQVSKNSLLNFHQRQTGMIIASQPYANVTCYQLTVANVALAAAAQNMIKIMLVQNGATIQDRPFLQIAEVPMNGSNVATFQPSDFH